MKSTYTSTVAIHTASFHTATTRIATFDLARGLAVLFMILVHVLDFYGRPEIRHSLFGESITFLGRPPAAPVFMFIMGVFIAMSSRLQLGSGLRRAAGLLLLGYGLNLARGTVPMWVSLEWGLVTREQLGSASPLSEFLIVDILQFAGLAYAVCVLVKHYLPQPVYWLVIAAVVIGSSPFLAALKVAPGLWNEILKLLWGGPVQGSMFPLFPWLAYPLLGMVFGSGYRQVEEEQHYFRRSLWLGLATMGCGAVLTLTDIPFHYGHYLHPGPGATLWILGFVLVWLWCCRQLAISGLAKNGTGQRVFSLLCFWSRHVTRIYVIQWLIIGWGLLPLGLQQLDLVGTLTAMVVVITLSDVGTRVLLRLQARHQTVADTPAA